MNDIRVESLEPNSHKYKAEKESRESLKPIVKKDALVSTKKSGFQKFADSFFNRDIDSIKDWLIEDVLIPGAQETLVNLVQMLVFNEIRGGRRDRRDYDDYRSYYSGRSSSSRGRGRRDHRDYERDRDDKIDCRDIVLKYREDAERIIDEMRMRIRKYDSVSVADLFDLLDIPGKYTDNNYGWTREGDIGLRRVAGGYLIDVPDPKYLD